MTAPATPPPSPADWVVLLRPQQWLKNAFILAPLLFSGRAGEPGERTRALLIFAAFCLLASGVYLWNDIADRAEDRVHPRKRLRPVASGRIGVVPAGVAGTALLGAALAMAWWLGPQVAAVCAGYLVLNVIYTLWLKRVVLLDVFAIATFFELRLLAGSVAVAVKPSVWLLLCGGLLALYLGFAKRRHELMLLGDASTDHRSVLADYSAPFLDQMSVVLLSVTIVSYIMYAVTSERAVQLGSQALVYSVPFVLYGVFRYLFLVHRRDLGSPTETLLADRSLVVAVLGWLAYCAWVLYRPR